MYFIILLLSVCMSVCLSDSVCLSVCLSGPTDNVPGKEAEDLSFGLRIEDEDLLDGHIVPHASLVLNWKPKTKENTKHTSKY